MPIPAAPRPRHHWRLHLCLLAVYLVVPFTVRAGNDYTYDGEIQLELVEGVPIRTIEERYEIAVLDSLPPLYLMEVPPGTEAQHIFEMNNDPDIVEAEYCWGNQTPEGVRQMIVIAVGGTITDYLDQNWMSRVHLDDILAHTRGDGIQVAVIDGGVKADHAALEGSILPGGIDFVDGDADPGDEANGIDDDEDGVTDEGAGHGTMVAGIVHLVAPNAGILPIRVLTDEGTGKTWYVAKAIRYAVEHGADVINLSLGLTNRVHVIAHEIEWAAAASVLIVSAAGNNGQENPAFFPASNDLVLSVAAVDSSDVKADFSNYHSSVDLCAPGVGILAPYYDGEYAIGAGTSFSAPFVTGQCALIKAANPSLSFEEIRTIVGLGVAGIYQIPGNEIYQGKLGTGRFDGLETWLNVPIPPYTGVGSPDRNPRGISSVFPNPSRSDEQVTVALPTDRPSNSVLVLDASGRVIRTIAADGTTATWDGRSGNGRPVAAGIYYLRMPDGRGEAAPVVRTGGD